MSNFDGLTSPYRKGEQALRWLFVKDMVLCASIGVYPSEHEKKQKIRVSVYYAVEDGQGQKVGEDTLARTVSYDDVVRCVRDNVAAGHCELVETLAEKIARDVLEDARILIVRVCVEKLEVVKDAQSVGVVIERVQDRFDGR